MFLTYSLTAVLTFFYQPHGHGCSKREMGSNDDINDIFQGDCSRTEIISAGLHVIINVLSTLLLGASNMCMQLLAAPTRSEIDKAYKDFVWLDIGVPSF